MGSFGIQGNLPGGLYDWKALYGSGYDYGGQPGNGSNQSASPSLQWEEQELFEVGLEIGLFNKLNIEATYYNRETKELILDVPVSLTDGVAGGSTRQNFGAMKNSGFEFKVDANIINTDDISWSVNGNITFNTNEITKLVDEFDDGTKIRREGEAYDTFWMPVWAGVNPANGNPMWFDENNELTEDYASAEFRTNGTAEPDFYGGFGTIFSWRGLAVNALFTYSYGNKIYNNASRIYSSDGAFSNINQNRDQLDRWQQPGDIAPNPRRVTGGNNNSNAFSTRWLEDGSFLRLRTVTLSYDLAGDILDQLGFSGIRVYAQGQNLLTFTEFTMDPEQAIQGTSFFIYPNAKTISLGVDLQF